MRNFTTLKKLVYKKPEELKSILPASWQIRRGRKIYKVLNGISNSNLKLGEGKLLYIKVSDMNNPLNNPVIIISNEKCKLKNEDLNDKLIPFNAIVFPKRGAAIFTNKVGIMGRKGTLDPNLIALHPFDKNIFYKFLFYYIKYFNLSNICENAGLPQLNKKDLDPLKILIPPINEQEKISSILTNLDDLMIKTLEIIKKLNNMKKGLMQRLFTEGIGHIEFKETRLGKIPEEWDVVRFNDLALKFIGGGTPSTKISEYWEGDIPWITSAILDKMYINEGMRYITGEGLKKSASNLIPKGSLLISTRVGIGKVGIAGIDVTISQDLTGVVIDLEKSLTEFVYWFFLNSKNKLINISQGTTVKGIERKYLRILRIALPPLPEQENITKILNNLNNKIINQRNYQSKLKKIKKGLMQDLLTGRKRVKIN